MVGVTNGSSWCFPQTRVSEGAAPGGAKSVLGDTVNICLSTELHSPHPHPPGLCFASGLRSAVAAVLGHQVVFFALSVLATLTCRMSHAWRLNALSPSSHLENKATANALWPDNNIHLTTYVSQNCSTAEKSSTVQSFSFQNINVEPLHIVHSLWVLLATSQVACLFWPYLHVDFSTTNKQATVKLGGRLGQQSLNTLRKVFC